MTFKAQLLDREFRLVKRVHFQCEFFPSVVKHEGKFYGEPKITKEDKTEWRYVEGNWAIDL